MTAGLQEAWQSAAMALLLNILWFVLGCLVMGRNTNSITTDFGN